MGRLRCAHVALPSAPAQRTRDAIPHANQDVGVARVRGVRVRAALLHDVALLLRLLRCILLLAAVAGGGNRPRHVRPQRAQRTTLEHRVQRPALLQQRLEVAGQRPRWPPRQLPLTAIQLEACGPASQASQGGEL